MVFFYLFLDLAKGNNSTPAGVVVNFVRIAMGGPLLGVVVGIISTYFLKKVIRDDVLTANITFIACYLCFWAAEFTWLKVSGLLSLVILGLYLSANAKTRIYP
jgi:NhaP-type Na+/H+ or K+/H+ antiporter